MQRKESKHQYKFDPISSNRSSGNDLPTLTAIEEPSTPGPPTVKVRTAAGWITVTHEAPAPAAPFSSAAPTTTTVNGAGRSTAPSRGAAGGAAFYGTMSCINGRSSNGRSSNSSCTSNASGAAPEAIVAGRAVPMGAGAGMPAAYGGGTVSAAAAVGAAVAVEGIPGAMEVEELPALVSDDSTSGANSIREDESEDEDHTADLSDDDNDDYDEEGDEDEDGDDKSSGGDDEEDAKEDEYDVDHDRYDSDADSDSRPATTTALARTASATGSGVDAAAAAAERPASSCTIEEVSDDDEGSGGGDDEADDDGSPLPELVTSDDEDSGMLRPQQEPQREPQREHHHHARRPARPSTATVASELHSRDTAAKAAPPVLRKGFLNTAGGSKASAATRRAELAPQPHSPRQSESSQTAQVATKRVSAPYSNAGVGIRENMRPEGPPGGFNAAAAVAATAEADVAPVGDDEHEPMPTLVEASNSEESGDEAGSARKARKGVTRAAADAAQGKAAPAAAAAPQAHAAAAKASEAKVEFSQERGSKRSKASRRELAATKAATKASTATASSSSPSSPSSRTRLDFANDDAWQQHLAREREERERLRRERGLVEDDGSGAGADCVLGFCCLRPGNDTDHLCDEPRYRVKESQRRYQLACTRGCALLFHDKCWRPFADGMAQLRPDEFDRNFKANTREGKPKLHRCVTDSCGGHICRVAIFQGPEVPGAKPVHELYTMEPAVRQLVAAAEAAARRLKRRPGEADAQGVAGSLGQQQTSKKTRKIGATAAAAVRATAAGPSSGGAVDRRRVREERRRAAAEEAAVAAAARQEAPAVAEDAPRPTASRGISIVFKQREPPKEELHGPSPSDGMAAVSRMDGGNEDGAAAEAAPLPIPPAEAEAASVLLGTAAISDLLQPPQAQADADAGLLPGELDGSGAAAATVAAASGKKKKRGYKVKMHLDEFQAVTGGPGGGGAASAAPGGDGATAAVAAATAAMAALAGFGEAPMSYGAVAAAGVYCMPPPPPAPVRISEFPSLSTAMEQRARGGEVAQVDLALEALLGLRHDEGLGGCTKVLLLQALDVRWIEKHENDSEDYLRRLLSAYGTVRRLHVFREQECAAVEMDKMEEASSVFVNFRVRKQPVGSKSPLVFYMREFPTEEALSRHIPPEALEEDYGVDFFGFGQAHDEAHDAGLLPPLPFRAALSASPPGAPRPPRPPSSTPPAGDALLMHAHHAAAAAAAIGYAGTGLTSSSSPVTIPVREKKVLRINDPNTGVPVDLRGVASSAGSSHIGSAGGGAGPGMVLAAVAATAGGGGPTSRPSSRSAATSDPDELSSALEEAGEEEAAPAAAAAANSTPPELQEQPVGRDEQSAGTAGRVVSATVEGEGGEAGVAVTSAGGSAVAGAESAEAPSAPLPGGEVQATMVEAEGAEAEQRDGGASANERGPRADIPSGRALAAAANAEGVSAEGPAGAKAQPASEPVASAAAEEPPSQEPAASGAAEQQVAQEPAVGCAGEAEGGDRAASASAVSAGEGYGGRAGTVASAPEGAAPVEPPAAAPTQLPEGDMEGGAAPAAAAQGEELRAERAATATAAVGAQQGTTAVAPSPPEQGGAAAAQPPPLPVVAAAAQPGDSSRSTSSAGDVAAATPAVSTLDAAAAVAGGVSEVATNVSSAAAAPASAPAAPAVAAGGAAAVSARAAPVAAAATPPSAPPIPAARPPLLQRAPASLQQLIAAGVKGAHPLTAVANRGGYVANMIPPTALVGSAAAAAAAPAPQPPAAPMSTAAAGGGAAVTLLSQPSPPMPLAAAAAPMPVAVDGFWQEFDVVYIISCETKYLSVYLEEKSNVESVFFTGWNDALPPFRVAMLLFNRDTEEVLGLWGAEANNGSHVTWRLVRRLPPMSKQRFHATPAGARAFPSLPCPTALARAQGQKARDVLRVLAENEAATITAVAAAAAPAAAGVWPLVGSAAGPLAARVVTAAAGPPASVTSSAHQQQTAAAQLLPPVPHGLLDRLLPPARSASPAGAPAAVSVRSPSPVGTAPQTGGGGLGPQVPTTAGTAFAAAGTGVPYAPPPVVTAVAIGTAAPPPPVPPPPPPVGSYLPPVMRFMQQRAAAAVASPPSQGAPVGAAGVATPVQAQAVPAAAPAAALAPATAPVVASVGPWPPAAAAIPPNSHSLAVRPAQADVAAVRAYPAPAAGVPPAARPVTVTAAQLLARPPQTVAAAAQPLVRPPLSRIPIRIMPAAGAAAPRPAAGPTPVIAAGQFFGVSSGPPANRPQAPAVVAAAAPTVVAAAAPAAPPPAPAAAAPPPAAPGAALQPPRSPASHLVCPTCEQRPGSWFLSGCKHMGPCIECCAEAEAVDQLYPLCWCGQRTAPQVKVRARV